MKPTRRVLYGACVWCLRMWEEILDFTVDSKYGGSLMMWSK